MKTSFWGTIVCMVVIIGIFNPWISKGSEPYSIINPDTGQGDLRYNKKIFLSPFYASIFEYHQFVERVWFVSIGTSISGIMLLAAALLSTVKYERLWVNFVYFIIAALSIVVFFMSLGFGLSIGLKTQIEGGIIYSLIGLGLMFVLSISEMMGHYSVKI